MLQEIGFQIKDQSTLEKIICDLKYALKDLTTNELLEILKSSSIDALKVTGKTKTDSLKKTGMFLINTCNRYKQTGVMDSLRADSIKAGKFLKSLPEKTQNIYNNFIRLSREEQIEVVAATILTVAIFFAVAGGTDFEGGLPDTDIAILGIGHHRNFIFHSILIGFGIEFTGRFSLLVLEQIKNRMPNDRHFIWDKVYSFIDKNKNLAISAMWLGVGMHLIKDSGVFGGGVTPYKDLAVSIPMGAHQGLFATNGFLATLFSNSSSN